MNILVCGIGSIGKRHINILKSIDPNIDIWAYRTNKSTIVENIPITGSFYNLDEALSKLPDAVLITNPTSLHITTALKVAQKGIPMFIEKPLSHNLDDIELLKNLVDYNNIPVLIGTNLIYHEAIQQLERLIKINYFGNVVSSRAQFGTYMPGWHPWEDYKKSYTSIPELGGGVILTSIHEISHAVYLFGKVKEVAAMEVCMDILDIPVEQCVEILLKHDNNIVSNIHLNFIQKPYRRILEVIGTQGTFLWDFMKPEIEIKFADKVEIMPLSKNGPIELLNESYTLQMEHFLEIVRHDATPKVSLEKGICDLKIALEILRKIKRKE
jgi:predicted dehydrogenase